jgi:prophage regulatory protein
MGDGFDFFLIFATISPFKEISRSASMTRKFLRLPAVMDVTGLSRSSIYRKISRGELHSYSLGDRAIGFLDEEISAWIQSRIDAEHGSADQTRGAH